MVDATDAAANVSRSASAGTRPEPAAERATSWAMVHGPGAAALDSYAALLHGGAVAAAPQDALWMRSWVEETAPDYLVASLRIEGAAVFALALEVEHRGRLRIARFMGGRHANGNFAPSMPAWLETASAADLRALVKGIAKARPDIDLIRLERQLPAIGPYRNPFLALPSSRSPNIALSASLAGGFEALLERAGGKRKRKKQRAQLRKFEAAGGHRCLTAGTVEEVDRLFDAFLALKHERFARMGIADVFAEPKIRNFFRRLFAASLDDGARPFRLDGLEVGGSLRAITGSSMAGRTVTCEFGAIRDDDLAHISPGEFLFFRNIQDACRDGFANYDFGVGDEPYKRQWCDVETVHFDTVLPLTWKGRIAALRFGAVARAKSVVKKTPALWRLAKAIRRRLAGRSSGPARPASDEE